MRPASSLSLVEKERSTCDNAIKGIVQQSSVSHDVGRGFIRRSKDTPLNSAKVADKGPGR